MSCADISRESFLFFNITKVQILVKENALTALVLAGMQENLSSGFPVMSDTNPPVQSQKQASILKFWI